MERQAGTKQKKVLIAGCPLGLQRTAGDGKLREGGVGKGV